ncbi:hypothetical protein MPH_13952 [Macrophomina phaseolina MS6]|uniref:Uncharacterized protein n=1 Tax=Macrophomina phaseolina (strain MS6) TaxID=1126212 RepID=K2RXF8_MACPH|nr:hypothetical protein MPH_13952 [Macrophomina phaseolina MS6]
MRSATFKNYRSTTQLSGSPYYHTTSLRYPYITPPRLATIPRIRGGWVTNPLPPHANSYQLILLSLIKPLHHLFQQFQSSEIMIYMAVLMVFREKYGVLTWVLGWNRQHHPEPLR